MQEAVHDAVHDTSLGLRLQDDASRYTLARFLEDVCQRHGDRCALRFEGGSTSYRELRQRVRRLAAGLTAAGVCKGARVAVWMGNRPEWIEAAFAVGQIGAVLVPVNTFATPRERDTILRHADASVLLLQASLLKHDFVGDLLRDHPAIAAGAPGKLRCPALPQLRRVYALGVEHAVGGVQAFQEVFDDADSVDEDLLDAMAAEVEPSDDGVIIYTSGTTSVPKGILHSQRAPVVQSWRFAELMEVRSEERVYTAQPFFWTAGMAMSLGATLAAGGCLILEESFDPGSALATLEAERATMVHAWPHQEKAMAEHPDAARRDLSSISRVEFSSPLAALAGIEKDVWGTYGSYGLSETFTLASALPASAPAELRSGTSGHPLPGIALRIVDPETGATLPTGAKGEIAVKGATLMKSYEKVDPAMYLDADGFFHTQDGGHLDADGFLHWSGRLSNLIKTGGANVSPLEIDEVASTQPGVRTAHAVGVPHPTLGEAIVLCATATEGATIDPEALRTTLRDALAVYKVPRHVLVFAAAEISFTGNQKVQVGPLREAALERLARDGIEIAGHRYGET